MADFCKGCSEKIFGEDFGDLKGLCEEGKITLVLCEGCGGYIWVDHTGARAEGTDIISVEDMHKGIAKPASELKEP